MYMFIQGKTTIRVQSLSFMYYTTCPREELGLKKGRREICMAPSCQHEQLGNYINRYLNALQHILFQWSSNVGRHSLHLN